MIFMNSSFFQYYSSCLVPVSMSVAVQSILPIFSPPLSVILSLSLHQLLHSFFILSLFTYFQIVEFVQSDREKHVTIPMFSRSERESDNASQKSNASKDKRDDDADWDRELRPMPSVDKLVDDRKVIHSSLHVFMSLRLILFFQPYSLQKNFQCYILSMLSQICFCMYVCTYVRIVQMIRMYVFSFTHKRFSFYIYTYYLITFTYPHLH